MKYLFPSAILDDIKGSRQRISKIPFSVINERPVSALLGMCRISMREKEEGIEARDGPSLLWKSLLSLTCPISTYNTARNLPSIYLKAA